jgi:GTP-binding protein Era
MTSTESFRSGLVVLAGRPNVGKSTLANALSGRHLAGVSDRPQTTRRRISAVVDGPGWQAVLLDLPGFQRPADALTSRMQRTVQQNVADCDSALFVLSATEPIGGGDRFVADTLRAAGVPVSIVINKVDIAGVDEVAPQIDTASKMLDFVSLHPVSARTGEGMDPLRAGLPELLIEGPRFFPEGVVTDQTEEELAGELIREAALAHLRQELPHALAIAVEDIEPANEGLVVRADLVVETESQKGIVIGKGGRLIREIGQSSRAALSAAWGTPVHTDLRVKVRRKWREDESMLGRLGL